MFIQQTLLFQKKKKGGLFIQFVALSYRTRPDQGFKQSVALDVRYKVGAAVLFLKLIEQSNFQFSQTDPTCLLLFE